MRKWIKHEGGKCPVESTTRVIVWHRSGETSELREGLDQTLDVVDGLYRKHGTELEADEVLIVQAARALLNPSDTGGR